MKKSIILFSLFALIIFVIIIFVVGDKPYSNFGSTDGVFIECFEEGNQKQVIVTSNDDIELLREVLNSVKWTGNIDIELESPPACHLKDGEVTLHIWYNKNNQIEVLDTHNNNYGRITGEEVSKVKNIIE